MIPLAPSSVSFETAKGSEQRVAYVIGSGSHAFGYLVQISDHIFQSPICYYTQTKSWGIAPGYESIPIRIFRGRFRLLVCSVIRANRKPCGRFQPLSSPRLFCRRDNL